jgi:TPR repeat protein
VAWFRKAAEKGLPVAELDLGSMYEHGAGIPLNKDEAAKWYMKAADQNFVPAMTKMGEFYDLGLGVQKDPIEAYKWLVLAAVQNDDDAKHDIADLSSRLSPEQIAAGKKAAQDWIQAHQPKR